MKVFGRRGGRTGSYVLMAIAGAMIAGPFLWILQTSFKRTIDISLGSFTFDPTLDQYRAVLGSSHSNLLLNTRNSLVVATVSTLVVVVVGSLAAYSLSRLGWSRWIRRSMLGWSVIFHSLPIITLVGPWFLLFLRFDLVDSLQGLILAHVTLNLPMTLWLMMSFFEEVPRELEEAAKVDGASDAQVFRKVALPLVVPGIVATSALAFVFSWNEFLVALTLTSAPTATVPIGVARLAQQFTTRLGEMAASSILSSIPALLVVFGTQRFIVKGLTLGALK